MIIVVMGVSGSGKTTIGELLASALRCEYIEGDLLHPESNIEKMSRGIPLTDEDRAPWLAAIHATLLEAFRDGRTIVMGCSALKAAYRQIIGEGVPVRLVYLTGPPELIRSRLEHRTGHFATADLLGSQLATLEAPQDAIVADIARTPKEIVQGILGELRRDPVVHVFEDMELMSGEVAKAVVGVMEETVSRKGSCSVALSGGSTPRRLYELLATVHRDRVPWAALCLFWCDERYVPPDDPRSNFRLVRETLLDHPAGESVSVHPMPTDSADPDAAALAYEDTLRRHLPELPGDWPELDLALLGLGADGHIASLFPGSDAVDEVSRQVLAVTAPAEPPRRLTLTLPVLQRANRVYILVAGHEKAPAVSRALAGSAAPRMEPTAGLGFARGEVVWWLDRGAAGEHE